MLRNTIATAGIWLLLATSVQAQTDDQRAANHFRAGTSYLSEGQNADALREFRAAYRLSGRPEMQYNIGLALERMGRWDEAREAYEHFIEERPDNPQVPEARSRIAELANRSEEEPAAATGSETEEAAVGAGAASDDSSGGLFASPVPWIVLGASAAVGVAALATGLAAHGINNDLEEMCVMGVCPASLESDADEGQTLATVSTVLTFTAIAGAAAGVALLFLLSGEDSAEHDPAQESVAWGVSPTPEGAAGSVRWSF